MSGAVLTVSVCLVGGVLHGLAEVLCLLRGTGLLTCKSGGESKWTESKWTWWEQSLLIQRNFAAFQEPVVRSSFLPTWDFSNLYLQCICHLSLFPLKAAELGRHGAGNYLCLSLPKQP